MGIEVIDGSGGTDELKITAKRGAFTTAIEPAYGVAGGGFVVSGGTTAVVAAALAANTTLMAMRFAAASSRKAFINKIQLELNTVTAAAAAAVPALTAFQKFTTATPTGGTARTPTRKNSSEGSTTDMTDVRDSNAALTVTSVVFTDLPIMFLNPAFTVSGSLVVLEWRFDPNYNQPTVLQPGEGLCLRTQAANPATMTWMYSYVIDWSER
jgi:hypothetical protein